ncbi:unnamed protein product [Effrenium voratum]|nr:unnamed protein product [Effrenium voratum]CAJ1434844.1 unnamed protein product [Effrenium voratum]
MCKVVASLKYIRCNFTQQKSEECFFYEALSLANRTAEKQKPGPLDVTLLFKEIVRIKKLASPHASMRDLLFKAVTEYNRQCSSKAWKIREEVKRLVYNLIRCPSAMLDILKKVSDQCRWEHSAFTMENLDGDWFVPGFVFGHPCPAWKERKAGPCSNIC